jgi:hypothetical protein
MRLYDISVNNNALQYSTHVPNLVSSLGTATWKSTPAQSDTAHTVLKLAK